MIIVIEKMIIQKEEVEIEGLVQRVQMAKNRESRKPK